MLFLLWPAYPFQCPPDLSKAEFRCDRLQAFTGENATHARNFPGATSTSDLQSERPHLVPGANVYTVWKRVCVTQSDVERLTWDASQRGWWSALRSLTPRRCSALKTAWIWLGKTPGVKWPATGVAPVAAAHWPVFLEAMTLTSESFQWQP